MRPTIRVATPDTIPHERPASRCARTCCWTPLGHSGAARACQCHEGDPMADHVPVAILKKLTDRDGRSCVMTGTETERLVPQHRQGGMGGRANKHRLANLLWLDSILNGAIKDEAELQAISKAWGVAVSIYANVEEIPVYRPHAHAWYLLTGDARKVITALEALDRMHAFYGDQFFQWKATADSSARASMLAARLVR